MDIFVGEDDGHVVGKPCADSIPMAPHRLPLQVDLAYSFVSMCSQLRHSLVPQMGGGAALETIDLDPRHEKVFTLACECLGQFISSGIAERRPLDQIRKVAEAYGYELRKPDGSY